MHFKMWTRDLKVGCTNNMQSGTFPEVRVQFLSSLTKHFVENRCSDEVKQFTYGTWEV